MTVSSTENRIEYDGNGVTTDFAFPYRFLADADLKVYVDDVLLTLTTDYTVTGEGEDAGGTVSIIVPPPTGTDNVVILRDPAAVQELDLVENDPLPAEDLESALDLLTMLHQRQTDRLDRAVVLSDSDTGSSLVVPSLNDRINNLLGFDADGDLVAVVPADIDPVLVTPFIQTLLDDVDADEAQSTLGLPGLYALLNSPTFTGTPSAPTPATSDDSTKIATTEFVKDYAPAGTYTPTLTNGTNVDASTPYAWSYARVGGTLILGIALSVDATTANSVAVLTATLPPGFMSGNFTSDRQAGGSVQDMGFAGSVGGSGAVHSNNAAQTITLRLFPVVNTAREWRGSAVITLI